MKRLLIIACFTLVLVAIITPQARAQVGFYMGFGHGGYVYGGYGPYFGWGYGAAPVWQYPYPVYGYSYAVPYASPFVTYGYIPPPRIYPQPLFTGYTLYLPRTRVYRPGAGRGYYGGYAPRVYRRYR